MTPGLTHFLWKQGSLPLRPTEWATIVMIRASMYLMEAEVMTFVTHCAFSSPPELLRIERYQYRQSVNRFQPWRRRASAHKSDGLPP